jgi:hypothetical protein
MWSATLAQYNALSASHVAPTSNDGTKYQFFKPLTRDSTVTRRGLTKNIWEEHAHPLK